jgi:hypothetical protein
MKKKNEKILIFKDSELSKTGISIIEANQSQQTIILNFSEKSVLSDFVLSVCKVSPLLGTPEKIVNIFAEFKELEIEKERKVFVSFSQDMGINYDSEEENLFIKLYMEKPFLLSEDEVIGLLKKENDLETFKIIDWAKPFVDEPISAEILEKLKINTIKQQPEISGETPDELFYQKKNKDTPERHINEKPVSIKPIYLILFLVSLIGILEIISIISFEDEILSNLKKSSVILMKDFYFGLIFFHWLNLNNKFSIKSILLLLSTCIFIAASILIIGLYPTLFSIIILILIITLLVKYLTKYSR